MANIPRQISLALSMLPGIPTAAHLIAQVNQFVIEAISAFRSIETRLEAVETELTETSSVARAASAELASPGEVIPGPIVFPEPSLVMTAIGASPNTDGATLTDADPLTENSTLTLQPADATRGGVWTAGTQTLGGNKIISAPAGNEGFVISHADTSGSYSTLVLKAGAGGNSSPSMAVYKNSVFKGSVLGFDGTGFGLSDGLTVSAPSGCLVGFRISNTRVGYFDLNGLNVVGTIIAGGTVTGSNLSGTNTGNVTLAAVGGSGSVNAAALSGQQLTLQPASATDPGVVTAGTQSFGGDKTFTGTITASNISGSNTGNVTIGSFGSTPNSNGASISSQVLTIQPADSSNPGSVSTTTQTFAGAKTFNGATTISNTLNVTGVSTLTAIHATAGSGDRQFLSRNDSGADEVLDINNWNSSDDVKVNFSTGNGGSYEIFGHIMAGDTAGAPYLDGINIAAGSSKSIGLIAGGNLLAEIQLGSSAFVDELSADSLGVNGQVTSSSGSATANAGAGEAGILNTESFSVITNSFVTASSIVLITPLDSNMTAPWYVPVGSGSFQVTRNGTSGAARFKWVVINGT